jgi:hypothetical protein
MSSSWDPRELGQQNGRTFLVTGGNSGSAGSGA